MRKENVFYRFSCDNMINDLSIFLLLVTMMNSKQFFFLLYEFPIVPLVYFFYMNFLCYLLNRYYYT